MSNSIFPDPGQRALLKQMLTVNLKQLDGLFIFLQVSEKLFCQDVNSGKQTYQEARCLFGVITEGAAWQLYVCRKTCFTSGFSFCLGQYMIQMNH